MGRDCLSLLLQGRGFTLHRRPRTSAIDGAGQSPGAHSEVVWVPGVESDCINQAAGPRALFCMLVSFCVCISRSLPLAPPPSLVGARFSQRGSRTTSRGCGWQLFLWICPKKTGVVDEWRILRIQIYWISDWYVSTISLPPCTITEGMLRALTWHFLPLFHWGLFVAKKGECLGLFYVTKRLLVRGGIINFFGPHIVDLYCIDQSLGPKVRNK